MTSAIVQARLGSTRLPGKVLMDLKGRTVLAHVLERCKAVETVAYVCCAIPAAPECRPLAEEAERCGVEVFRGSEEDVLDRYLGAALAMKADVVLRVTSDCPLIDPEICAEVVQLRNDSGADFACNNLPPTWPHGLDCEAFTVEWLERAARETNQSYDREHVTPYIRSHPEARKANLEGPGGAIVRHRWTLDTEEDLAFLRALCERMPDGREGWTYDVPLAIVEADPALASMNVEIGRVAREP